MAEEKMRESVTQQIQGEIDVDEEELRTREREFSSLQSTDTRAEKRQKWMQSISGQAPAAFGAGAMDPSALGARPDGLGAAAGRPLRGLMGQQNEPEERLGLGNMRAPMTSAKPLATQQPAAIQPRAVRQPIGQATMPQPVRNVRQPIAQEPQFVPQEEVVAEEIHPTEEVGVEETSEPVIEEEVVSQPELVEEVIETVEPLAPEPETTDIPTTLLRPVAGVLQPLEEEAEEPTARITPVGPTLMPGPPISSNVKPKTAALRPVRGTLTPVEKAPVRTLQPHEEEDESQN